MLTANKPAATLYIAYQLSVKVIYRNMSQSANGVYTPTMTSIIVNNTALQTPAGGDKKRN